MELIDKAKSNSALVFAFTFSKVAPGINSISVNLPFGYENTAKSVIIRSTTAEAVSGNKH